MDVPKCLANEFLVFVGDSTLRQMYLMSGVRYGAGISTYAPPPLNFGVGVEVGVGDGSRSQGGRCRVEGKCNNNNPVMGARARVWLGEGEAEGR